MLWPHLTQKYSLNQLQPHLLSQSNSSYVYLVPLLVCTLAVLDLGLVVLFKSLGRVHFINKLKIYVGTKL